MCAAGIGANDPAEEVVEVPMSPPISAPQRASSCRSTASTSDRFGTIRNGSCSIEPR
jgi:hypothetical protein